MPVPNRVLAAIDQRILRAYRAGKMKLVDRLLDKRHYLVNHATKWDEEQWELDKKLESDDNNDNEVVAQ